MSRRDDRKHRKKKEREKRNRRQKQLRQSAAIDAVINEAAGGIDLPSEADMERMLWDRQSSLLGRIISGVRALFGGGTASDPRVEARELAFDAIDADTRAEAAKLAKEAVAIDPDCVDALRILALNAGSRSEQIQKMQQAVAAGERSLGGPDFFAAHKGEFWRLLETRPYMRARSDLAELLQGEGRLAEAIGHYEAMLDLNPNDNQGVRDTLRGVCFLAHDLDGVRRLLERYPQEGFATYDWALILERFLSGDLAAAGAACKKAQERNPHVKDYLIGKKRLPQYLPEFMMIGDETEAFQCVMELGEAWRRHPKAVAWLRGQ